MAGAYPGLGSESGLKIASALIAAVPVTTCQCTVVSYLVQRRCEEFKPVHRTVQYYCLALISGRLGKHSFQDTASINI